MKIKVLSDQIINQIAAGEVIENPASVVKELIENALDAGATQIAVEIKGGGLQLIRVIDNGCGMSKDDALLSLERHATSKIVAAEDLFALKTMGFRGEALASIASISKLTLLTADGVGTRVEVDGGKIFSVEPCARTQGTTVEVRSLFFNVPARKKFQKSAAVCATEITRSMTILSLAHPGVSFDLIQQDRPALSAPRASLLLERIAHILGEEFCGGLLAVDIKEEGFELKGFIGAPHHARHKKTGQYLFINKRAVTSPLIAFAVRDAYATRLSEDKHPVFVLHLAIDPHLVDVNVHPQKREVRFCEEEWVKSLVKRGVSLGLQENQEEIFSLPSSFRFQEPLSEPFENTFVFKENSLFSIAEELPIKYKPRIVGVYKHFLFLEEEDMIVVDLVAASERIAFEQLVASEKVESQGLMIPVTLEFSTRETDLIHLYKKDFEDLGMSMRLLGTNVFMIDALPAFLDPLEIRAVIIGMIEESSFDLKENRKERFAKIACQSARRKSFSLFEAEALYEKLLTTSFPKSAPSGRKTMISINQESVSKLFK
ncbi:MAG: DNA mismatch repair endonuclease MutL [Chlamydiota bacterium]